MAQSNTVLVTGGAGYIGSHTCKLLAADGRKPVVFDSLLYGHREFVQWGPFEQGDLADPDRLDEVFEAHRPSAVVHFAALTYVGESVEQPGKYYANNVAGTLNLLNAMVKHEVKHIVFSSTCATYGIPKWIPLTENHPQNPINPYGRTKLTVEKMLEDFDRAHGLKSVALRYFNAAGASPDGEIGEDHNPETHLIPIVLDVALGRREKIMIFGNDYETPDGTCIRDYIHIEDLGDAHLLALKHMEEGGKSERFNLGNGEGFSVREVIDLARETTGKDIPAEEADRRPGDPPRLVGDASKAREILGWKPRYPQCKTIIEHAWNFHKKRFE